MKQYYAIIPAEVRYDERLTPNAKLMFGEITALTNGKGYCWANNRYFSELYKVSRTSISKWINQLAEYEYIIIEQCISGEHPRKISLNPIKISLNIENITEKGVSTNVKRGYKEKLKHNTTVNNTINNNIRAKSKKPPKTMDDFSPLILKSLDAFVKLFPETNHPKDKRQKIKWLEVIDQVERIEKVNPRQLYLICSKAREDGFWKDNFLTLLSIRKKRDGVSKLDRFLKKFGKDIHKLK